MKNHKERSQSPKDFFKNKSLPKLGNTEAEWLLWYMVKILVENDKWVAIGLEDLLKEVKSDVDEFWKANAILERNLAKRRDYEKTAKWNWLRRLFGKEFTEPKYEEVKTPKVTPFIYNFEATVRKGIQIMKEKGYITVVKEGENNGFLIITDSLLDIVK